MPPSGSPPCGSGRPGPPTIRGPMSSPSSASSTSWATTGDPNGCWSRTCSPAPSPNSAGPPGDRTRRGCTLRDRLPYGAVRIPGEDLVAQPDALGADVHAGPGDQPQSLAARLV